MLPAVACTITPKASVSVGGFSSPSSPPRWSRGGMRKATFAYPVATAPASPVLCQTGASTSTPTCHPTKGWCWLSRESYRIPALSVRLVTPSPAANSSGKASSVVGRPETRPGAGLWCSPFAPTVAIQSPPAWGRASSPRAPRSVTSSVSLVSSLSRVLGPSPKKRRVRPSRSHRSHRAGCAPPRAPRPRADFDGGASGARSAGTSAGPPSCTRRTRPGTPGAAGCGSRCR
jgi:hypothetical protein